MKLICKRNETQLKGIYKKQIREYEEKHNIKLNQEEISNELLPEIMTLRKTMKPKRATQKYDMSNFKIITPNTEWWFNLIIKSLFSFVFIWVRNKK